MHLLHKGSGSWEVVYVGPAAQDWEKIRKLAIGLMKARKQSSGVALLENIKFTLCDGTNYFGDEYVYLNSEVDAEEYVRIVGVAETPKGSEAISIAVKTLEEIGLAVRFIALSIKEKEEGISVPKSGLESASVPVIRSFADLEILEVSSPSSAVDRLHTFLHGYFESLANAVGIICEKDETLTSIFKKLRSQHPAIQTRISGEDEVNKILNGMAAALDSLNRIRNHKSLAHPNEKIIDEAEAKLCINIGKSIYLYISEIVS